VRNDGFLPGALPSTPTAAVGKSVRIAPSDLLTCLSEQSRNEQHRARPDRPGDRNNPVADPLYSRNRFPSHHRPPSYNCCHVYDFEAALDQPTPSGYVLCEAYSYHEAAGTKWHCLCVAEPRSEALAVSHPASSQLAGKRGRGAPGPLGQPAEPFLQFRDRPYGQGGDPYAVLAAGAAGGQPSQVVAE
jgi:hypothetical protein